MTPTSTATVVASEAIDIALIRRDGGTQPRDHVSVEVARDYADAIVGGAELPPATVFYDGTNYWLADGFHRALAHDLLELTDMPVEVRQGSRRDAILFSVGANADHGYRRSNADKRRAILALLNDAEWAQWSDREIARVCRVDGKTVAALRPTPTADFRSDEVRVYQKAHGRTSIMRVGAIGRPKPQFPRIGGHIPDRSPQSPDLRPTRGSCGIAEASLITGFDAKRLKTIAEAGEIGGVKRDGGRLYFDHQGLAEWMAMRPASFRDSSPRRRSFWLTWARESRIPKQSAIGWKDFDVETSTRTIN